MSRRRSFCVEIMSCSVSFLFSDVRLFPEFGKVSVISLNRPSVLLAFSPPSGILIIFISLFLMEPVFVEFFNFLKKHLRSRPFPTTCILSGVLCLSRSLSSTWAVSLVLPLPPPSSSGSSSTPVSAWFPLWGAPLPVGPPCRTWTLSCHDACLAVLQDRSLQKGTGGGGSPDSLPQQGLNQGLAKSDKGRRKQENYRPILCEQRQKP